jgi:hypothetical protein
MATLLCLNELSCKTTLSADDVDQAMRDFVGALKQARQIRAATSLISSERLPAVELAAGYPMAKWANDARNKDLWRLVRAMQQRAPFTFEQLRPSEDMADVEYLHEGTTARGLGLAHFVEGLGISLPTEPAWSVDRVVMTRNALSEDGDLVEGEVGVRHASTSAHVQTHRSWLERDGLNTVTTGAGLWEMRAEYFPRLSFLPRVEDQLRGLSADWVIPVRTRLIELQEAVSTWTPATQPQPTWLSRVTPEAEQRKQLCEFVDLDGLLRVFDLHARFTPRHGRLHFRLLGQTATIRIAHIGPKLGV